MPGMILVIEDEPGIVDFLERGLRAQGFEVISATDGTAALPPPPNGARIASVAVPMTAAMTISRATRIGPPSATDALI